MTLENLPEITATDFGVRIAKAFLDIRSSNVWFFTQQAYKDVDGFEELEWSDVEELLKKVIAEGR